MAGFQVIENREKRKDKPEKTNPADISNWLKTEEFAGLCGLTERAVRKNISEGRYKKIKVWINSKGNPAYKIHYSELPAAVLRPIMDTKMLQEQRKLTMQPDEYDAESAWEKWQTIKEYFTDGTDSIKLAEEKKIPSRTLQRWISAFRGAEDGWKMAALAKKPRKDKGKQRLLKDDVERAAAALYLRQSRPTMAQIYRQMKEIDELSGQLPSLKTIARFLNSMPPRLKALAREGEKKYRDNFDKIILRDLNSYEVRAVYVGDHHQFDVFVEYRGRLIRPWLTAWKDFRTRCITGWTINERPSSDTIATSLRDALLGEQSAFFGIPETIVIDNGKDYRGKRLNGEPISFGKIDFRVGTKTVLSELGIKVKLAEPYNARSKPIERWFRTLEEQFCRGMAGWCGNKPQMRPDSLQKDVTAFYKGKKGYFYTLDELREDFRSWLFIYHDQPHSGLNNMTPLECWERNAGPPRIPTNQTLIFLLMKHLRKAVRNGGIRIFGTKTQKRFYWHPALANLMGSTVDVRYDPQDITKIYVFQGAKFIGIAENRELIGADAKEEDLVNAIKEQKRIRKQDKERVAEIIAAWKEPDLILRQAAKRGEKKQEEQRKAASAASVIHSVPEFEGDLDRKSMKNISESSQENFAEYLKPLSKPFEIISTKPKSNITDDYLRLIEKGEKDDE